MPQILDTFDNQDILRHGFLPDHIPLNKLRDPYYQPWEDVASKLPDHIAKRSIRETVNNLPILSTENLREEEEWRRAYVVLAFLLHAYIWGGEVPEQVSVYASFQRARVDNYLPPIVLGRTANDCSSYS